MDDVHSPLCPHHGEFRCWPGHVVIALQVFARHGQISATVGFSGHERQFWHGRLRIGKQQFRAMAYDAAPFLNNTGEEPRNVFKREQGDVERIASSDEPCRLDGSIDVQTACQHLRLVAHHAHR